MSTKKLFTQKLQELIAESGKLQNDICKDLGVSKQKLTKLKLGYNEPSLDEIVMLAKYFNVTTDYLLGLED